MKSAISSMLKSWESPRNAWQQMCCLSDYFWKSSVPQPSFLSPITSTRCDTFQSVNPPFYLSLDVALVPPLWDTCIPVSGRQILPGPLHLESHTLLLLETIEHHFLHLEDMYLGELKLEQHETTLYLYQWCCLRHRHTHYKVVSVLNQKCRNFSTHTVCRNEKLKWQFHSQETILHAASKDWDQ